MESFCLEAVVTRSIGPQQDRRFGRAYVCIRNGAPEENKGRCGVGERIVPAETGKCPAKILFQAKVKDEIAESEGFLLRPDRPGNLQGIDPWTKTVEGKCAQKPSLRCGTMGNEPAILEQSVDLGPKVRQSR